MIIFLIFFFAMSLRSQSQVFFFDSNNYPIVCYDRFRKILKKNGFDYKFYSFSDVLASNLSSNHPDKETLFFINLSIDYFKSYNSDFAKLFRKKVFSFFNIFSQRKKLFFVIPNFQNINDSSLNIFRSLLNNFVELEEADLRRLKIFLLTSFTKKVCYPTALYPNSYDPIKFENPIFHLRAKIPYDVALLKNDLFFSGGLIEDIRFMPLETNLIYEAISLVDQQLLKILNATKLPKMKKNERSKSKGNTFVWMEIPLQSNKIISVDEIIEKIVTSSINNLWITPAINDYFSLSSNKSVLEQEYFIKKITVFFEKLIYFSKLKKKIPPTIYFSIEIANNIKAISKHHYRTNLDLYGYSFFDQPDPLDINFWLDEAVNPFKKIKSLFFDKFKDLSFGIILDLEMYLRKTSSLFSSLSGFSEFNIRNFYYKSKKILQKKILLNDLDAYLNNIQNKAFDLGKMLHRELSLEDKIRAGIYMPVFIPNWFYTGFFKGFFSKKGLFISFNMALWRFKRWFINENILFNHIEMFMLSKLNLPNWKKLLDHQRSRADVCFNRFSRVFDDYVEPDSNGSSVWFELEQARSNQSKLEFIDSLKNLNKSLLVD